MNLSTVPMCAHCELAAATVQAVRAENERLHAEVRRLRPKAVSKEKHLPRPRSGWDFVMELKDRGLRVLDRDGQGAKRWMCSCPAHEDRYESLSVTELNDGKLLLNCFAGCPTERVLDAVGWSFAMLRGDSDRSDDWVRVANARPR